MASSHNYCDSVDEEECVREKVNFLFSKIISLINFDASSRDLKKTKKSLFLIKEFTRTKVRAMTSREVRLRRNLEDLDRVYGNLSHHNEAICNVTTIVQSV